LPAEHGRGQVEAEWRSGIREVITERA